MATRRVLIEYNDLTDVVSAFFADTRVMSYRPAPADNHLMLEIAENGAVVGVEVLGATHLTSAIWLRHPDRSLIPTELLGELDRWLAHRWADVRTG